MKTVRFLVCLLAGGIIFYSCKKTGNCIEEPEDSGSIIGTWELYQSYSGMTPVTNYPRGNGYLLEYDSTNYKTIINGQVVDQGAYHLKRDSIVDVQSCTLLPAQDSRLNTIVYYNNPPTLRIGFEISQNILKITSGCIPLDGGWALYRRVR